MNKYILILIPFIFGGCQKDFNSVIDTQPANSQVLRIIMADSVTFNQSDSLVVISVQLNSSTGIKSVEANIIASDLTQLNSLPITLYDNGDLADNGDSIKGDNIYSNKYPFSSYNPNGTYTVQYFTVDNKDNTQMVAEHSFVYNNNQTAAAPVISNLTAPDTVTIGSQAFPIYLSIQVEDANGFSDVRSVYFNSFIPPNGQPSSGNPFIMNNDGNGLYSLTVQLPATGVPKGTYLWEFEAVSNEGLTSNIITHYIVVK
ncbi:MAG: hypothetical protein WCA84_07335 [Ignavibacteriaceae bacterium]|jgi:hypothetical protein